MESEDTLDVVQTVIECDGEYLLAKRSKDSYWEFIGGKVKEDENLRKAAIREINEETDLDLEQNNLASFRRGDSYLSEDDSRFRLNPVYFGISEIKKNSMTIEGLSKEHTDFEWIELSHFDQYDTLGQFKALEHLDIVNGRVAIAAVRKGNEFLVVKRSSENSTPGKWGFVSGGIENGEDSKEAAVRELKEETGLKAEPVETGDFYIGKGEKGFWRLEPVLLEYEEGTVDLNWELSDYRWVEPNEFAELDSIGRFKAVEKLGIN